MENTMNQPTKPDEIERAAEDYFAEQWAGYVWDNPAYDYSPTIIKENVVEAFNAGAKHERERHQKAVAELREIVLHGLEHFENHQINTILGLIDDILPAKPEVES